MSVSNIIEIGSPVEEIIENVGTLSVVNRGSYTCTNEFAVNINVYGYTLNKNLFVVITGTSGWSSSNVLGSSSFGCSFVITQPSSNQILIRVPYIPGGWNGNYSVSFDVYTVSVSYSSIRKVDKIIPGKAGDGR